MATYYVRKTGSDSNNGTSPATAWLTFTKALGATGCTGGDTVYIGAGVYRETMTAGGTYTSVANIIGDVTGTYTGDPGEVRWTAWTTSDTATPASTSVLVLTGKRNLSFSNITFHGGSYTSGIVYYLSTSETNDLNFTFTNCVFTAMEHTSSPIGLFISYGYITNPALMNVLIDSCIFMGCYPQTLCPGKNSGSADYDPGLTIKNCLIFNPKGGYGINIGVYNSSGTYRPGNQQIYNNTVFAYTYGIGITNAVYASTSLPSYISNNFIYAATGIYADNTTSTRWYEDYNRISAATPRSSFTASGANSVSVTTHAILLHIGQEILQGRLAKPPFTPALDCPILGFGNATSVGWPASPSVDLLGRPRPSGPGVSQSSLLPGVGCLEHHDIAQKETTTVDTGYAIKMVGYGDQELLIPVSDTEIVISIKVKWDSNHADTTKPQFMILEAPEIGVSAQTITATGVAGSGAWETLQSSSFTPTAAGWIKVRVLSRPAAANGIAYFDTLSVA